ncbi:MAG: adenosylcobalamin-dependent ribonucleoside-diphosphate reductase [Flavobacteriales bacterium]|nr:adenosylcobalamin-dependent ribonucleoside-diphosphate reductase [Flavobacteriales bacterium]
MPTTEAAVNPMTQQSAEKKSSKMPHLNYEEALVASTAYFEGDELAASVWISKYALKDSSGRIYERTPDDMHQRLASEIARVEAKFPKPLSEEEIFEAIERFKYVIPQGGPMAGIGNGFQVASLSNCFVIGESSSSDSYGAIMQSDQEQVQLMKRRGGVGHDLSHIRPTGTPVQNSALTATGVVPFMERYSNSTREVAQDGRRGALMLSISIEHPDAERFIDAKLDGTKITGANVSVKLNDAFMRAAINGESFEQRFPVGSKNPKVSKQIDAQELWKKIVHNAWKSAEPGILFWDTVLRESIPDRYAHEGFETVSTNPCGEIPLCPYDSCRLLAINLFSFVDQPFSKEASFDRVKFKRYVRIAQRIADDIIELELEKIDAILKKIELDPENEEIKRTEHLLWKKIREKCIKGRRTGTGITGEGDMLAALGLRYGSDASLDFTEEVHKTMAVEVYRSSVDLAQERGSFPIYDAALEEDNPFIARLRDADPLLYDRMLKHGRRNIAALTIAPTGTTSLMSQTTSGIEPVFMVAYKRRKKVNPNDQNVRIDYTDELGDHWQEYHVLHKRFVDWLLSEGLDPVEVMLYDQPALNAIIARSPYHNATARDVDWLAKVRLQGRIQQWVDHSISVTVNVPEDVPEALIEDIYRTGWETGCKGMTVYREGSRSGVLVAETDEKKKPDTTTFDYSEPPKRPQTLEADIVRFNNEDEKWIAVIGLLDGKPYEIFTGKAEDSFRLPAYTEHGIIFKNRDEEGKSRYDFQFADKDGYRTTIEGLSRSFNPEFWNYAKLISGVMRHGMPLQYVVHMINNLHLNDDSLMTWKNGVIRALKRYIPNGVTVVDKTCPSCGEDDLVYEEGCLNCKGCGHSECG